jgi:hypothetical protein
MRAWNTYTSLDMVLTSSVHIIQKPAPKMVQLPRLTSEFYYFLIVENYSSQLLDKNTEVNT